jgi:predicted nucleotidyltransferase
MREEIIKTEIRKKMSEYFSPETASVFIFGSRASGNAKYNSDWDIGVMSKEKIPGHVFEKARESLEEIQTLQSFDLVDFANVPDSFKKIAVKKIISLIGG